MDDATPLPTVNRQVLLAQRPHGPVDPSCFRHVETPVPDLEEGQALLRVLYVSLDPTIRGWMESDTYLPAIPIGDPIRSGGVAEVIASRSDAFNVGDRYFAMTNWQEYVVADASLMGSPLPPDLDPVEALGVYGTTGITAWAGMIQVADVKDGDTVLVSGAAGGTGSVAGQVARILGAGQVVGIAGSDAKCAWLTGELGFDAAINYRTEDVDARIGELCPDGVDVFFDNVGGDILEAALNHISIGARVVLCGAISGYNDAEPAPGPRNLMQLVIQRARMEGFLVLDFLDRFPEAALQLAVWVSEGKLKHREDVVTGGIEVAPSAFDRLFTGENMGKLVVQVWPRD